ncbi:MAG: 16S rRNA (uracil(1498)-N(3))-methyltransferase [Lentimicrobiaceae bacterium]|jgi:16S rRNA (uracil1498-N3)-methyltransferase|nr:16S rRNA (uracil(1498)-N(3))-methyltransferase [Lentimicrobiaceae bacterium]MCP4910698.1 16S rRNA (uracil(1498)-N(3))-methyltransferase [Bacteroidota bacterium]MBT3453483.1 16S rRNA (uracil(1498)-N(3))-methyltransferase [Lentimicrobiaceae bacterium]MBT3818270.1 16S rRNA (uracil(1498)-N(3))-methyltransferase [Lentimicrobiaceae bacterium]MBT4062249.1 16S rRNA (uracil(1498)-N(3))-methyltransferase [Lentimicrobiaceae bacterium]
MNLFYSSNINVPQTVLGVEESKHIIRVLRKTENDEILFTDGKGFFYECRITDANPKRCVIEVINKEEGMDIYGCKLHIAIAPTKNITRLETFLEKATEIGIQDITPLICHQSERKEVKIERLQKIIISAMKQSLKSKLPKLNNAIKFEQFVKNDFLGQKFIAYIDNGVKMQLSDCMKPNEDTLILIGPEGDFSKEEVKLATSLGYIPVSLGKSRLRTETAGIVACHTVSMINT